MGDRETAKGSHLDRGLEPSVFETPGSRGQRRRRGDLHICPECGSDLVYPTDWAPASERHWQVALRCPECEWNGGSRSFRHASAVAASACVWMMKFTVGHVA